MRKLQFGATTNLSAELHYRPFGVEPDELDVEVGVLDQLALKDARQLHQHLRGANVGELI